MAHKETDYLSDTNSLTYWARNASFEHCSEAILVLNPLTNRYIDCNIRACQLLGYSRHELLSLPITAIHGRELPHLVVFTEQVLEEQQAWTDRITCKHKGGEHLPVEISASRVNLKNSVHLVFVIRDLASESQQIKHAEAERLIRQGLLEWRYIESIFENAEFDNRLMLTSVGDGIYCVDTNGLAVFVNPAAAKLLGWENDELVGKNIHYVHHHSHPDGTHYPVEDCPIYAAIRDGVTHEGKQEVFWRKDGTPFPVEFTSTPVISKSKIIGAVVVFRDISERLLTEKKLREALEEVSELKKRLEEENAYLQEEIRTEHNYREIVGQSAAVKRIAQQIDLVGPTDAAVLITGESGTGKELIARAIHESSPRKEKSMIRVNCAAIPHELFESEFFGHIKGAFTGALRDRTGRFELADGGTLFLDEVGEIPLNLQGKLLRVLQEGQFERLGEEKTRKVNVRIIAATNRDLKNEIELKNFREDLYFRLNVFPINSPPLRERLEDVPILAAHFLKQAAIKFHMPEIPLRKGDIRSLQTYHWPGNIRELQNVLERGVIAASGGKLHLDIPRQKGSTTTETYVPQIEASEKLYTELEMQELIRKNTLLALQRTNWKLFGEDGAANLLGIKPTTLASRIRRLDLKNSV